MKLFAKGILFFSVAVFSVIMISPSVNALSLSDLFNWGKPAQHEPTQGETAPPASSDDSPWYSAFKKTRPAPETPPPTTAPENPAPSSNDNDGDGLSASQEDEQATSDTSTDTDGDGLSDLTESRWNAQRADLFCGTSCAYPNPTQKDLYIETDWMVRPDGTSVQPTAGQVKLLTDAFAKENITLHVDTGQYGGGNAVPYNAEIWFGATSGEADFVDYKRGGDDIPAQFDKARDTVWHYMLVGERYKRYVGTTVDNGSSGVANASGPNSFIAFGVMPASNRDVPMAGTMMHELGHNLCLTEGPVSQTSGCTFPGIDNSDAGKPDYAYQNYRSSMNYLYQFQAVDYSHNPTNSPTDHDDWSAVRLDVFPKYSESANGQSPSVATTDKRKNNILEKFSHVVSARAALSATSK